MSVTTWNDVGNAALRNLKVIAPGETAAAQEMTDLLIAVNMVLGSLSAQAIPIPFLTSVSVTMTGVQSYALPTRPLKIEAAMVTLTGSVGNPVSIVPVERWIIEPDKTAVGAFAKILWWDAQYPTSNVFLAPMPRAGTLQLMCYMPLTSVVAWTDAWNLPPGYDRALMWLLTLEAAYQFGVAITQQMTMLAADAKTAIQGLNAAVLGQPSPEIGRAHV